MDTTVRLQMKNNQPDGIFSIEGTNDTFTITKGIQGVPLLNAYLSNSNAILQTENVLTNSIISPNYIFQKIQNDSEVIVKSIQSEVYGLKYHLPSRFHSHRFTTRYGENQYNEWMRIQQGRLGRAQVGIGTTIIDPNVGLHVNGIIRCDKIITHEPILLESFMHSNLLWLDDTGKIPNHYLPEQYQVSIIQNEAGVGIGTRVPVQKLHLEGGCYIRDRLGIGHTQPNALLHVINNSSTLPSVSIEQDTGKAIHVIHAPTQTPFFSVSPSQMQIGMSEHYQTTIQGNLKTNELELKRLFIGEQSHTYLESSENYTEITTPTFIRNTLHCDSIESTNDLSLKAHSIHASNTTLYIKECMTPLVTSSNALPLNPDGILEEMHSLECKLYKNNENSYECGFIKENFINNVIQGNETATLLFDGKEHINQSTMIHLLWTAVQHLSKRVKELEGQKS